jgi:hypothetical protein
MSNSDLLGDQQGRIENRNIQQDLVRAECSWLKEVQDADKLLEDIEDELSKR